MRHESAVVTYHSNTSPRTAPTDLTPSPGERPPECQPTETCRTPHPGGRPFDRAPVYRWPMPHVWRIQPSSYYPATLAPPPPKVRGSVPIQVAPDGNRRPHVGIRLLNWAYFEEWESTRHWPPRSWVPSASGGFTHTSL